MRILFGAVIFALIFSSCSASHAKLEVENLSTESIDSLIISNNRFKDGSISSVYSINIGELKKIELDMQNVQGDGNYSMRYKFLDIWNTEHFGYFTNGSPMEDVISIKIIDADSVRIDYEI